MVSRRHTNHIVLCGLDGLGFRTLEELRRLGEEVVVIARRPDEQLAAAAQELGATLVEGSYRTPEVLRQARVSHARGIVITENNDVGNLHAALHAHELNPSLNIVVHMFNQEFGERVQEIIDQCTIVSSAAIAAPAFVAAALYDDPDRRI